MLANPNYKACLLYMLEYQRVATSHAAAICLCLVGRPQLDKYIGNCIPALKPRLSMIRSYCPNQTEGATLSQAGRGATPTRLWVTMRKPMTLTRLTV